MADGSPTGYDNTDATSGDADQEVFIFDATAEGGAGALSCISCNPTASRPAGRAIRLNGLPGFAVAATIPTWTSQLFQPRVITEDGRRAFFTSYDRLVANDVNGKADVYEWERAGTGDCSVGASAYVSSAAGCVSLVSSGDSTEDSTYVDTSASGDDVFFKTYSSIAPQDPGLIDIYDARIGGGFAPPPAEKPECLEESCQPQVPAPPNVSPNSDASSSGNPKTTGPKGPKHCPKGKHKVKRKGKAVCVKNKKKHHRRHSGRAGE
jgi:hypothetical protein